MSEQAISDLAARCIRCGFCLEDCPTFLVTGKETESPRGRIYLIRSADDGTIKWDEPGLMEHIDTCVGCRNCETVCPSGVEYGNLLELARAQIEERRRSKGKRMLLSGVTSARKLRFQLALSKLWPARRVPGFVSRLVTSEKPQADKPRTHPGGRWPELDLDTLPPVTEKVSLLIGCAMGVLFPRVHEATRRLLRRVGIEAVNLEGCCGALHMHNGFQAEGASMAEAIVAKDVGRLIVTNSAGCGSFLKEHTGAKVEDISETLIRLGLLERLGAAHANITVTYHDACHLAHGQRIAAGPRQLIRAIPGIRYAELREADLCCGSGGIYNLTEPSLARKLLDRKWENVAATGASIVLTGNPGCHAWIEQRAREAGAKIRVMHTAEFLETALSSLPFRDTLS